MTAPRTILVAYDHGSASPTEILAAAEGLAEVVFVADERSAHVHSMQATLAELAPLRVVRDDDPDHLRAAVGDLRVDAVITYADAALPLAWGLSRAFGTRPVGPADVRSVTDKLFQRRALVDGGVTVPRFRAVAHAGEVAAAGRDVGFPAVLKPRVSSGSRHTYRVCDERELLAAWATVEAVSDSCGGFILESQLAGDPSVAGPGWGDYVSVESLVRDAQVRHLAIVGRLPLTAPFRETGLAHPPTLAEAVADDVRALAARAIAALGITDGLCHTEVKLTPDGPAVIEINGRLGGDVDKVINGPGNGTLVRVGIAAALGDTEATEQEIARLGCTGVRFRIAAFGRGSGTVRAVHGASEIRALPEVSRLSLAKRRGDLVDVSQGTFSDLAVVFGQASDHAGVLRVLDRIQDLVYASFEEDGQGDAGLDGVTAAHGRTRGSSL